MENFIFGSVYDLDFVAFLTIVLGKELTAKIRQIFLPHIPS